MIDEPLFARFKNSFKRTDSEIPSVRNKVYCPSFISLIDLLGGSTFEHGLYRIHSYETADLWDKIIYECFPSYKEKVNCFGFDWYGRQYATDRNGKAELFMFDCAAFEDFQLTTSLEEFHNKSLVESRYDTLLEDEFQDWFIDHPDPLHFNQCVGFKVPLFMGGIEDISNLELVDMNFYWAYNHQLYQSS